ncbi:MAG: GlsB/YeaQ/YmgE family stress response membrane protein [Desulfomonilia bacterium]|uniref:GlsB/YeaQ/YmgE family stress response membrane protein n=1 Tax=anaerobic digester metagenome TaxID=1263854 RepID=A0A485LXL8_9ZZZZ|nr:GlsB/YeaQ/YmgE family stress response membrane protein [Pseudomonadota bacterium]HON37762.1 GlsB/YeaQ/YmgE family stress response membrane protein [Deltaproteobacteria bacterium]HRS55652.1 GlsB/YeaQ/YmgE family stress response membrane protein [Desulfomonilia bacterium]HPD20873.1 GlsB/YeaQ/YmgE family stress response membrane protein [Deltaproteobacteria bacterium]HPX19066.1 GlsB/YeaQ/YmgE family stress response membrane protein [Deltaproteobacteria bacterium]
MGILSWILLGLIVGALAKWIMPGRDPGGIIVTMLLGIAGALVGGAIASLIGLGNVTGINIGSIIIAVLGAILILVIYRRFAASRG